MNKEQVIGLLRHLLPFIGGMATARGWITQEGWSVFSEQLLQECHESLVQAERNSGAVEIEMPCARHMDELPFKTISVPRKGKRVEFKLRRCDECGKVSINSGYYRYIPDEQLYSAMEQLYLQDHPSAASAALEFDRAEIREWVCIAHLTP
jgi:hypothetical protein